MALQNNPAHAAGFRYLRDFDSVDRPRLAIGKGMHMDIDDAFERSIGGQHEQRQVRRRSLDDGRKVVGGGLSLYGLRLAYCGLNFVSSSFSRVSMAVSFA